MTDAILNYAPSSDAVNSIDWNRAILFGGIAHALLGLAAWLLYMTDPSSRMDWWVIGWVSVTSLQLGACVAGVRGVLSISTTRWLLCACVVLDLSGYAWSVVHLMPVLTRSQPNTRVLIASAMTYLINSHWPIAMIFALQPSERVDSKRALKRLLNVAVVVVSMMLLKNVINAGAWYERLKYALTSFGAAASELGVVASLVTLIALVLAMIHRVSVKRAVMISATAFATAATGELAAQAARGAGMAELRNLGLVLLWVPTQLMTIYLLAFVLVFRIPIAKPV